MKHAALAWVFAALGLLLALPAQAADTVYYYSSDTIHSEVVVTDQNRNVVERTYYAPYGQVLNRDLRDGPGYTGHEEDPETNLVYMQQRYYDPEAGRFLSTDPVQADGEGGSFNRYEYANDNPYRYTDPNGMAASCSTGTHIGGAACGSLNLSTTIVDNSYRRGGQAHPVHMSTPQRVAGAIFTMVGGTAANELKRPDNPTKIPNKLAHQLFMTGAVAVGVAASPDAIALGASALPATPEAAAVAGRAIAVHGQKAAMAACLAVSCHGTDLPDKYAEDRAMLQRVYEETKVIAKDVYTEIIESGKNGQ